MAPAPCVRFLRDYVAIPSVNPMGRDDLPPEIAGERRYAEHLCEQLRRLGLDAAVIGEGERRSVVAEARAAGASETVLVASHLDTVPVDGMEIPPFDPAIQGERLFGRGSCDTKGGMAALVDALARVLERGRLRRNLILVGEADEELGSRGVHDVLHHLGARRPDWVLATEPTELRLVTHHKGIALARLEASGVAAHSSRPESGRNAIVALARAVLALDQLAHRVSQRRDPRLGPATLSVGQVGGGQAPNIVPDSAWLVTDRRLLPGEDEAQVRAEIEGALAAAGAGDVRVASCRVEKGALGTADHATCVRACRDALRAAGLPDEPAAVSFGTDAGVFAQHGIPGVVFGPGSIAQAHTAREYVELAQLERAADWFARLLGGG
jgi:acetylornithine deacetylase/succinyl-diaminopimelate desuccinylase-like protein